jgi:hypothetical protein
MVDQNGDMLKEGGKNIVKEGSEEVAEGALKTGGKTAPKGGQSLGKAFAQALPKLGPMIGGVALIAAGVLAVAAAITFTVKKYNKARDAAKKASETA